MAVVEDRFNSSLILLIKLICCIHFCITITKGTGITTTSGQNNLTKTETIQRISCGIVCENGGSCRLHNGEPLCKCSNGYHGYRCELLDDTTSSHDDTISLILSLITSTAMIGLILWGMIRLSHRRNARGSPYSEGISSRRQSSPERGRDASEIRTPQSQSSLDPNEVVPSLYTGIAVEGTVPYSFDLHPPPDYYSAVALYASRQDSREEEDKAPGSPPTYEEVMNCRAEDVQPQADSSPYSEDHHSDDNNISELHSTES
ncbi:uncharacterized protein LOC100376377 [Saccoglossus kowalevskii]|uniref:Uncharacterized protein LOC100376377 n=1 Tax=Saccoglossus kowalevskii TaxID=10224 RepID=A0ABM0MJU6_SACKO|nr:PREDICTED: uncharacterized protein LOC100376377 [Saccoglossus kowalevskii]